MANSAQDEHEACEFTSPRTDAPRRSLRRLNVDVRSSLRIARLGRSSPVMGVCLSGWDVRESRLEERVLRRTDGSGGFGVGSLVGAGVGGSEDVSCMAGVVSESVRCRWLRQRAAGARSTSGGELASMRWVRFPQSAH